MPVVTSCVITAELVKVYCFQVFRDSDFVSSQYLENELMECIRMENGI